MKQISRYAAAASAMAVVLMTGPAMALHGYSTTQLNLRSGPGTQYPIVGVMDRSVQSDITGCIADWSWCAITAGGVNGWASSKYIVMAEGGTVGPDTGLPVVGAEAVVAVAAVPAVGALVGWNGHVDAIVPEPAVLAYIAATPVPPVAVEGEVVVGAVLPVGIELAAVPGSVYGYAIVNGVRVLVEPTARTIVYIHH